MDPNTAVSKEGLTEQLQTPDFLYAVSDLEIEMRDMLETAAG